MHRTVPLAALLLVTAPLAAQTTTLQQDYEAAQAAFDAGKFREAAPMFEALLKRMRNPDAPGNKTAALIRARLGSSQYENGDASAAVETLEKAIPALSDPTERVFAYATLGLALEGLLKGERARTAYEAALSVTGVGQTAPEVLRARLGLGRVSIFTDPAVARRELDLAIALIEADKTIKGDFLGDLYALRGRVELNHGTPDAAHDWFEKALRRAGGLSRKVSIADTRIRSDLAIANHLMGRNELVQKYMAFTGAGYTFSEGFGPGADMRLPECGEVTGLSPEDRVIVEFAISDSGAVAVAVPIWSSRPGFIERPFLESVTKWSWSPAALAKMEPFWRASVRFELRCETTRGGADIDALIWPRLPRWPQTAVSPPVARSDALQLPILRAELQRQEAANAPATDLFVLSRALALNSAATFGEQGQARERALRLAKSAGAPSEIMAALELWRALNAGTDPAGLGASDYARERDRTRQRLIPLVGQFEADPALRVPLLAARLWLAYYYEYDRQIAPARAIYEALANLPAAELPPSDPVRQLVYLRLASMAANDGVKEEAQRLFAKTGLSAQQCAIADVRALPINRSVSGRDFPAEAARWAMDGYVRVAFDVDAGGKPKGVRAVLSYPPFIFNSATERAVGSFRYAPVFRDGATEGCVGQSQAVRFKTPR